MSDRFLPTALRRVLEKAVKAAREVAEEGAADAVRRLGVADAAPPAHLSEEAKSLRRRLRAHARTLGDTVIADGVHEVRHLVEGTGYAQWHRRLFARFLAERGLLRHPEHGPVTLDDCEELAKLEGFADAWAAAEAYGSSMLPGVFLPDDPVLTLELAPEHAQALRRLVDGLDPAIFEADDSLGWTYQFWRAAEKDRVNKAGEKIGARDLPAVTQLFTEPYMVKFLLHNTLGAWRAGKVLAAQPDLAANAPDEAALRMAVSPPGYTFDMLRFVRDGDDAPRWRPAAGTFPGWPQSAGAIRTLDPCCGSGHFLTETLAILSALRADEEGLTAAGATVAVLRDNLFGLELDGRCVQIAAFAVALTAWKLGGMQPLPSPHIAWVGAPPPLPKTEFISLSTENELREGLSKLWDVFAQAPILGSLIEPTSGDLVSPQRLGRIRPLLDALVSKTRDAEPARAEGAVAARGMADAAALLALEYTLIATNVPFLGRGKQSPEMIEFADRNFPQGKNDLSTMMLARCINLCAVGGTVSAVAPQAWMFLGSYKNMRNHVLNKTSINLICRLGSGAFESITGEVVNVSIFSLTKEVSDYNHQIRGLDVSECVQISDKRSALCGKEISSASQALICASPDAVFVLKDRDANALLSLYADSYIGQLTGDGPRFIAYFWEIGDFGESWTFIGTTVKATRDFDGCSQVLLWERGAGRLAAYQDEINRNMYSTGAWKRGWQAWGKVGVRVSQMGSLSSTIHWGPHFDNNCAVLVPKDKNDLLPVWCFCSSDEYAALVREIDQKVNVTNATLVKVPFDIEHWRGVANEKYPNGLPEPYSDDPTQWLFHGHPAQAQAGTQLHVALARLAGYRWPAENNPDMHLSAEARRWVKKAAALPLGDNDGLLSLEAVAGEQSLAQRLRGYLAVAFGEAWSDALERRLIADADQIIDKKAARDGSLEAWLRDRAFRQHCRLFHDRPFLWQVWDGSADGFSAFAHYQRLDSAALGKLTYTVLGDWITRMTNAGETRRVEAAKILQQRLTAILDGEAPLDIFVRWKPLEHQPIGWAPDLDDGVRVNIRPFVKAGVLRDTPKISWGVDRGSDVPSAPWFQQDKGKRNNDRHLPLGDKQAARGAK